MKQIILIFCTCLWSVHTLSAQWSTHLGNIFGHPQMPGDVQWQNDRLLVSKGCNIYEFDPKSGVCAGYLDRMNLGTVYRHSFFIRDLSTDPQSERLFLTGVRNILPNSDSAYAIAICKPGVGYINYLKFRDSLNQQSYGGPIILENQSHQYWVLGRKYIRQLTVSAAGTLQLDWEKNLPLEVGNNVTAAIKLGSNIYAVTKAGSFIAFDQNGDIIKIQHHNGLFSLNSLTSHSNGLLAVGTQPNTGGSVVVHLDLDGQIVWQKMPGDETYMMVKPTSGGAFLAGGSTLDGKVVLVCLDANGNLIWRKTYHNGRCGQFLELSDGSLVVSAGQDTPNSYFLFKTDPLGQNELTPQKFIPRSRTMLFGDFSLTQVPASSLFFDYTDSGLVNVPAGMASTIFTHSPWIGAKDEHEFLRLCAGDYGDISSDYALGHIKGEPEDFNRLWYLNKDQILDLRQDFLDNGVLDRTPAYDLLTWPGKGNPHFRLNPDFTKITSSMDDLPAPFVDVNGDLLYNVYDGDYPVLKGDQMLWWMFNDSTIHENSSALPLQLDFLVSLYTYNCSENQVINQSLFAEYCTINRSSSNYQDTYFGFFTDPDLGCYEDDYVGSMPPESSFFIYNEDAVDGQPGSNCSSGSPTFNDQVPVQSVSYLSHSMDRMMCFNQNAQPPNPFSLTPSSPPEFYSNLMNHWKNGTPLTYGGTGYNPNDPNAVPASYAFSGNPADQQEWTMCAETIDVADRVILSSHGPLTWNAADTLTLTLAFTFHANIPHPCPDVEQWVKPGLQQLRQWYNEGSLEEGANLGVVQMLPPGQSIDLDATTTNALGYQWSTGATTATITVNQPGSYTVNITMALGCGRTETFWVLQTSSVNSPKDPVWSVHPNPAMDLVTITMDDHDSGHFDVLLRNAQGQLVKHETETNQTSHLQLGGLPAGLYWLELYQNGKFLGCRKLLIQ